VDKIVQVNAARQLRHMAQLNAAALRAPQAAGPTPPRTCALLSGMRRPTIKAKSKSKRGRRLYRQRAGKSAHAHPLTGERMTTVNNATRAASGKRESDPARRIRLAEQGRLPLGRYGRPASALRIAPRLWPAKSDRARAERDAAFGRAAEQRAIGRQEDCGDATLQSPIAKHI